MSTESVVVCSLRSLSMTDNPFAKPRQTAASSTRPIQPCEGEAGGKEEEEKRKKKTFRAEECLVLIYTWRRERAEGSGPCWSYAVLCDKIAQLAWTFRKRRMCLTLPGRRRLYLRCPACVYPPAAQHAHPPNSCRWWVSSFFSHPPSLLFSLKPETLITGNTHRQEYTAWCRIHHYLFHHAIATAAHVTLLVGIPVACKHGGSSGVEWSISFSLCHQRQYWIFGVVRGHLPYFRQDWWPWWSMHYSKSHKNTDKSVKIW